MGEWLTIECVVPVIRAKDSLDSLILNNLSNGDGGIEFSIVMINHSHSYPVSHSELIGILTVK